MKFKVGDKVRIVKNIWVDGVTRPSIGINEVHTIKNYSNSSENPYILDGYFGYCWCDDELELVSANQKIVVTTDGKITTAKLYENGKVVKTTEAKCCPEDTFDFNVGAKLAVERLTTVEKKPVEVDGFKVGDRVHVNGHNGTIICIAEGFEPNIGVEFDDGYGCHNCGGFKLRDGNYGTKHSSSWRFARELTHGEVPKYYNGKVVCVANNYGDKDFTVGKVYDIIDGKLRDNKGAVRPNSIDDDDDAVIESLDSFNNAYFKWWHYKFIPFVEN